MKVKVMVKVCGMLLQELENDVQQHSAGLRSVMGLCEILSRDSDACPTPGHASAISAAGSRLHSRWTNIRHLCTERKRTYV